MAQNALRKERYYEDQRGDRNKKSPRAGHGEKPEARSVHEFGSVDYTALLVIVLLLMIGVVMVFSAGYYTSSNSANMNNDAFYFLKRQGTFAIIGFLVMLFMSNFNYQMLKKWVWPLYIFSNALLVGVFVLGSATNGAKRWINLPIIGTFQPSELSKFAIILAVSYLIYSNKGILKTWKGFFICSGLVGVTALLVLLGNLSTALIVGIVGFGIIFVVSPHITRFVVIAAAGASSLVAYMAFFSKDFRGDRFAAWLNPFADPVGYGFQTIQSLYAVASGGLFGLGIGQSRQKSFVPEPHNDFIFSIICEELGFIGAALIILLFGILVWRGIKIALDAVDSFGFMVATGIVLVIASQVIINIAVVTNTIPNTGIPLPLISSGGTSLIMTMFMLGVLLNISRYTKSRGT